MKLVLFTQEGIDRQIEDMRENKPWSDTSLVLEAAPTKKKPMKGKRGGRGSKKATKAKKPKEDDRESFDAGKI